MGSVEKPQIHANTLQISVGTELMAFLLVMSVAKGGQGDEGQGGC